MPIDMINFDTHDYQSSFKYADYYINFFKNPNNHTKENYLIAVKKYGLLLRCVNNQSFEICLQAVKQDGLSLIFVQNHK